MDCKQCVRGKKNFIHMVLQVLLKALERFISDVDAVLHHCARSEPKSNELSVDEFRNHCLQLNADSNNFRSTDFIKISFSKHNDDFISLLCTARYVIK